ncbi:DNA excision repair protein ERCC-6-like [Schistocerca gregaria]|uniref:DNA excision repair protein ERCC-6-like n=1 Tax=Schistocerca gregaria TaxID=7010 RepID=UPI00211DA91D|nr:DNA excision repair protein ERCC-6-like [Schistocerca gregaria]
MDPFERIEVEPELSSNENQGRNPMENDSSLESAPILTVGDVNLDKFMVNMAVIETVPEEQQDSELKDLGLSVYDQETFEKGVLQQVDRAVEDQKRKHAMEKVEKELKNVSDEIQSHEQTIKKNETLARALLAAGAEGLQRSILIRKDTELKQKQLKVLHVKHTGLEKKRLQLSLPETTEDKLENVSSSEDDDGDNRHRKGLADLLGNDGGRKETEMEKKIRLGEMTPFGTVLGNTGNKSAPRVDQTLSEFEKYLEAQSKLQQTQRKKVLLKKKALSLNREEAAIQEGKSVIPKKKSSPLKKSILLPKKRKKKEKLGSSTSEDYQDQLKRPGKLLSEKTALEDSDEGSEYIPSEDELREAEDDEEKTRKWEGPSLHHVKKRRRQKLISPPEEWCSDDSDWDYSDEERRVKKRKRSKKEIDDGNADDYMERLKLWEKTRTEETVRGDQELEGGYRIPKFLWNKLYNYQKVGVQWLWELNLQRCGGILGDEMGLGKTVQVIAFLAGLAHSKLVARHGGYRGLGPVLIVCPTTVMHQWVREFHTWWPPFRVAVLHESGSFDGRRESLIGIINSNKGILVTSYVGVVQHKDALTAKNWHYVILDEGHKIRNPDAQVTLAVKMFRTPHRIILSGSPMQNSLKELWSLFDFVFPGKLGTLPVFLAQLAVPITQGGYANASEVQVATAYRCATVLRDTISPYLLRRMKSDVKAHIRLPQKTEHVLFCRLTDEQRQYYKAYLDSGEVERILQGYTKVFLGLINLRKICNHPDLYSGGPKLFRGENEEDVPEEQRYGHWKKSGKMIVIESLLKIWKKQGHRVLLFTQSRQMLCVLESFVQKQGYKYLKLDGGTSIAARQPLITKYNEDTSYFLFLLTTRVGGLGVNLTGANRVVIYDPDWNPATDTQARERAWRIGQQNNVTVYRLVTAGTIEEKVYHRQIFKQFLTNKVLQDPRQRRFFKSNDLFELFTLKETDVEGSTETSAIFAGTGSEVKVNLKKDKKILNHKMQKYSDSVVPRKPGDYHKSDLSVPLSQSKLNYMKELAQKLSKKIGSSAGTNFGGTPTSPSASKEQSEKESQIKEASDTKNTSQRLQNNQKENDNSTFSSLGEKDQDEVFISKQVEMEKTKFEKGHSSKMEDSCMQNQGDNINTSKEEGTDRKIVINVDAEHSSSKIKEKAMKHKREESQKKHKHKHKHKKKHSDVFEGERVPHLVGQGETKPSTPSDEEDTHAQQDDYVLKQLFKKSGLQTALHHDRIMEGSEADYSLVEGEAQRVAKEAVKALKESRQQCFNAGLGMPTWTGQHGVIRVPGKKPCLQFGKKKKSAEMSSSPASTSKVGLESKPSNAFTGKLKSGQGNMSSGELLARIRARNRLLTPANDSQEEGQQQIVQPTTSSDDPNVELLTDIRNFIAYGAAVNGRASTQEIVDRFKDRLPPGSSPLFKFLLQEISEFHRTQSGEGVWKLRAEFKWS